MYQFALPLAAVVVAFVAGVVLSQKVKDWFAGVPAHVRTDLSAVEATLLGRIKAAQSNVLADLKAKVTPANPVLPTTVTAAVSDVPKPTA
jgi:hypothetical protein